MERHFSEAKNRVSDKASKETVSDLRRMRKLSSRALLKELQTTVQTDDVDFVSIGPAHTLLESK